MFPDDPWALNFGYIFSKSMKKDSRLSNTSLRLSHKPDKLFHMVESVKFRTCIDAIQKEETTQGCPRFVQEYSPKVLQQM